MLIKILRLKKKLSPLCEALSKYGFDLLVKDVNIDVRNAINHGGVLFKESGKKIEFIFSKCGKSAQVSMYCYDFDKLIERTYDAASGVLLGISMFINENIDKIVVDRNKKLFNSFTLLAMKLSIPSIRCKSIVDLPNNKQINIDIYIKNTDKGHIFQVSILLAILLFESYDDYDNYFLSFSSERLQGSWIRFQNEDVKDMILGKRDFSNVVEQIIARGDRMIFDTSTEKVNLQEIKYHRFPNFTCEDYKINRVEDASLLDRKRLKAHLFIGEIENKEIILEIINKSIEWIKGIRNVPSATMPHKYGDMEADTIYINVYRYDGRKGKEFVSWNDNFVCFVDYNIDGNTTLQHGGTLKSEWEKLHHERINNIEIAWRESKYMIRRNQNKIGRNDPCPCKSNKKYKNCCGKK